MTFLALLVVQFPLWCIEPDRLRVPRPSTRDVRRHEKVIRSRR